MFLVGGGILVHGVPGSHQLLHSILHLPFIQSIPEFVTTNVFNGVAGIVAGAIVVAIVTVVQKFWPGKAEA